FANGGFLVEPFYIERIEDAYGNVIEQANPTLACKSSGMTGGIANDIAPANMQIPSVGAQSPAQCFGQTGRYAPQIISEQVAFLITESLKSVIWGGGDWSKGTGWQGTAWRAAKLIKRHDIAGKTGTTNESRDTWFSGFNPTLTSTFWVGFDDHGRQLGRTAWNANGEPDQITGTESGAKTAGPGWNEFMNNVLKGTPEATAIPPEGIVSVRIDLASGKLTRKTDYTSAFEYFVSGTEPKEYISESQDINNLFNDAPVDDLFQ
ncbi:MAG: penicillin-sensitive transpeptidase, partial [Shewanella sp.]